jgi:hypothetical protein
MADFGVQCVELPGSDNTALVSWYQVTGRVRLALACSYHAICSGLDE